MISIKKTKDHARSKGVVGLDIEASSVAATELRVNGAISVGGFGVAPLDPGAFRDGEVQEPAALGETMKDLFATRKLPHDVRIGIANQRVAVRTLRLPRIDDPSELETAIRFQAQDQIPMPIEQSVLDWQVIPAVSETGDQLVDVVVVAARRDMLAGVIEATRRAGLNLVGIDHSAFALIRALARESTAVGSGVGDPAAGMAVGDEGFDPVAPAAATAVPQLGRLYCNLGDLTNLAVARGSICLFTRVLNFGIEGIAQALAESSGLTLEHARQWLSHVGLEAPVEEIEGDPSTVGATRKALAAGTTKLVDELRRSLEYYATLEDAVRIETIVVAGPGTAIPGLVANMQRELPLPLEAVVPEVLARSAGPAAGRLTLSYGLGLEE